VLHDIHTLTPDLKSITTTFDKIKSIRLGQLLSKHITKSDGVKWVAIGRHTQMVNRSLLELGVFDQYIEIMHPTFE